MKSVAPHHVIRRVIRKLWLASACVGMSTGALAQQIEDLLPTEPGSVGEGWAGFTDVGFLVDSFLTLTLASILGAVIAFHPKHGQTADTLEEVEAPKVFVLYAVIGAIIGIMVVKYGYIVGFAIFGIGGLIRFRTLLRSATLTGQVILATLIGLSCGLDLPNVAVLATVFGFVLVYALESRITYVVDVKAVPGEHVVESAAAYRAMIEQDRCRVISEKKDPTKQRIRFIIRARGPDARERLQAKFEQQIDPALKGTVDWEID